eukprot:265950_1
MVEPSSTKIIIGAFLCVVGCTLLSLGTFYLDSGLSLIDEGEDLNDNTTKESCLITERIYKGQCTYVGGRYRSDKYSYAAISSEKCGNETLPLKRIECPKDYDKDFIPNEINQNYTCFVYNSCLNFAFDNGDSKLDTGNLEETGGILMLVFGGIIFVISYTVCYYGGLFIECCNCCDKTQDGVNDQVINNVTNEEQQNVINNDNNEAIQKEMVAYAR